MKWSVCTSRCVLLVLFAGALLCSTELFGSGMKFLSLQRISGAHGLRTVSHNPDKFVLRKEGIEFVFKNNSRTFWVNNVALPLGFSCAMKGRQLSVTYSDYISHIVPFLIKKEKFSPGTVTVVLDPGHGGHDHGAVCNNAKEKMIALDIAQRTAKSLSMRGYRVFLTRTTDTFLSLDQRTNFTNQHNATIFISIHCNSAEAESASGIETFALTPCGQPSYNKTLRSSRDLRTFANNKFNKLNLLLAYNVQRYIINNSRAIDRGVRHSRFHVFKALNCPGILVECGFLSNPKDRRKLCSEQYRQLLAEAISTGISKFVDQAR